MGAHAITRAQYDRILAAYRAAPQASFRDIAKASGCSHPTAGKAWREGWPQFPWALPIKDIIAKDAEEEQVRKRAAEAEEARKHAAAREDARSDATKVHDEERNLARATRRSALQLAYAHVRIGDALQPLADKLKAQLLAEDLDAEAGIQLLRAFANSTQQVARLSQTALELERLHRGDPTQIIGIAPVEMSAEDAVREIEAAQQALARFKRKGLEVVDGGLVAAGGGQS